MKIILAAIFALTLAGCPPIPHSVANPPVKQTVHHKHKAAPKAPVAKAPVTVAPAPVTAPVVVTPAPPPKRWLDHFKDAVKKGIDYVR